jgi:hypothetical protein
LGQAFDKRQRHHKLKKDNQKPQTMFIFGQWNIDKFRMQANALNDIKTQKRQQKPNRTISY